MMPATPFQSFIVLEPAEEKHVTRLSTFVIEKLFLVSVIPTSVKMTCIVKKKKITNDNFLQLENQDLPTPTHSTE